MWQFWIGKLTAAIFWEVRSTSMSQLVANSKLGGGSIMNFWNDPKLQPYCYSNLSHLFLHTYFIIRKITMIFISSKFFTKFGKCCYNVFTKLQMKHISILNLIKFCHFQVHICKLSCFSLSMAMLLDAGTLSIKTGFLIDMICLLFPLYHLLKMA